MNYTDKQLERALAEMSPNEIEFELGHLIWKASVGPKGASFQSFVSNSELLYICQRIELNLDDEQILDYVRTLLEDVLRCFQGKFSQHFALANASWQNKVIALAKTMGIEII